MGRTKTMARKGKKGKAGKKGSKSRGRKKVKK